MILGPALKGDQRRPALVRRFDEWKAELTRVPMSMMNVKTPQTIR